MKRTRISLGGRLIVPVLLFTAFLILLLVSLSLPIIKSIYLFEAYDARKAGTPTTIGTSIRFGLWGLCIGAFQITPGGTGLVYNHNAQCTKAAVGYQIPSFVANLLGNSSLVDALLKGFTVVLILHPVACGLTFLAFLGSLTFALYPRIPHAVPICTLLVSILPAIVATGVFVVDIIIVLIARTKVQDATNGGLTIRWANAVWLTAAAMALLWISVIGLSMVACGCFGLGRAGFSDVRRFAKEQMKFKEALSDEALTEPKSLRSETTVVERTGSSSGEIPPVPPIPGHAYPSAPASYFAHDASPIDKANIDEATYSSTGYPYSREQPSDSSAQFFSDHVSRTHTSV